MTTINCDVAKYSPRGNTSIIVYMTFFINSTFKSYSDN